LIGNPFPVALRAASLHRRESTGADAAAASFDAGEEDVANGGFQESLRVGQGVVQPCAFIELQFVHAFLIENYLSCFAAAARTLSISNASLAVRPIGSVA